jgi:hypothetical protein
MNEYFPKTGRYSDRGCEWGQLGCVVLPPKKIGHE